MSATLHILNGDATLLGFNDTGIDGDVMVWREVFSEGPLTKRIDANFWKTRSAWICEAFNDTPANYARKVIDELAKLNNDYTEINLWFEFDLHCQANLLGVMQLLQQETNLTLPAIYLICPDGYPDVEDFRGMGQLNGEQLSSLFDGRLQLTEYDFELAGEAWSVYAAGDGFALQQWINEVPFWGSLHMLKPALEAQVKRLTVNHKGLNYIEQQLLNIYQSGKTDRPAIYQAFWSEEKIFGMGDAQLDIYLNNLARKNLIKL